MGLEATNRQKGWFYNTLSGQKSHAIGGSRDYGTPAEEGDRAVLIYDTTYHEVFLAINGELLGKAPMFKQLPPKTTYRAAVLLFDAKVLLQKVSDEHKLKLNQKCDEVSTTMKAARRAKLKAKRAKQAASEPDWYFNNGLTIESHGVVLSNTRLPVKQLQEAKAMKRAEEATAAD